MADVLSVTPADGAVDVYLGATIVVEFDELMDEYSINEGTFVVSGPDSDMWSGPDLAIWDDLFDQDDLLRSPGYKGIVSGVVTCSTLPASGLKAIRTQATFTPDTVLYPNVEYTVLLAGSQGSVDPLTCITARSVLPVVNGPNIGSGVLSTEGSYTGTIDDTITITILATGAVGTATFKWVRTSDPLTEHGPYDTGHKVFMVEGLTLNFESGSFVVGDTFSISVVVPDMMETVYKWSFTTSESDIEIPPAVLSDEISEPCYVPGGGVALSPYLEEAQPPSYSVMVPTSINQFVVEFNNTLEPTSVTDDTVTVEYQSVDEPSVRGELPKNLAVTTSGTRGVITITL